MSFLNHLKSQAHALQAQQGRQQLDMAKTAQTEAVCRLALSYRGHLARHLNVLEPAAAGFSLDGRTPWPPMKLRAFRVTAWPVAAIRTEVMDDPARLIVSEPSCFV